MYSTRNRHLNGVCFVDKVSDEDELKKQLNEHNFNEKDVIKATSWRINFIQAIKIALALYYSSKK